MADLLRRFARWFFPSADPDAIAALDGGPGPEPVEPNPWLPVAVVDEMRAAGQHLWVDEVADFTDDDFDRLSTYDRVP